MKKKNTVTLNELITEKMVIMENDGKMNSAHNYRTLLHFVQKHFGIVLICECGPFSYKKKLTVLQYLVLSPSAQ